MSDDKQPPHDVTIGRMKQVFVLFAIIAGFFVVAEHRAHLIPYLPWLLLLACPLMHMFMHHGHRGHHHHGGTGESAGGANDPRGPGYTAPPGPGHDTLSGPGYAGSGRTSHHQHGDRS